MSDIFKGIGIGLHKRLAMEVPVEGQEPILVVGRLTVDAFDLQEVFGELHMTLLLTVDLAIEPEWDLSVGEVVSLSEIYMSAAADMFYKAWKGAYPLAVACCIAAIVPDEKFLDG